MYVGVLSTDLQTEKEVLCLLTLTVFSFLKPISSFEQGIIQKSVLETGLKVGMDYIESVD